jgi:hypothetical protein
MPSEPPAKSSTAHIETTRFAQHGVVEIWMEGDVMHYEATGPFNAELVDSLAIAQREFLLTARPTGVWVSVCTVKVSAMSSPQGIARYAAVMAAPKPDNMVPVATAFVVAPDVEGRGIMAVHFARIYKDIQRAFQMFETSSEAQSWVQQRLEQARAASSTAP